MNPPGHSRRRGPSLSVAQTSCSRSARRGSSGTSRSTGAASAIGASSSRRRLLAREDAAGRDADAWQAPDPVDGFVTEFMLIVPTRELRPARARRRADTVRWIDPAPPTEAIRVVLARYLPGTPMEGEAWSTPLSSGEILVVVVVAGPLNDEETALLALTKATLAAHAADAKTLKDPAGFMSGQTADRTRFWIVVGSD